MRRDGGYAYLFKGGHSLEMLREVDDSNAQGLCTLSGADGASVGSLSLP